MNLIKYEVFVTVAEVESFTKAAYRLNMTQSAVSRSIKSLEEEFQMTLFTRKKEGVALNVAGELVLIEIKKVINAQRKLENKIYNWNDQKKGKLIIGSFSSASFRLLPAMVYEFKKLYPNVTVDIREGHYDEIQRWVNQGSVDIGFVIEPFVEEDYVTRFCFKDSIKMIAAASYNLSNAESIKILEDYPLIVTEHYPNPYILNLFKTYGMAPEPQYVVKTNQTVFAFVEKGMGLALIPESSLIRKSFDLEIIDLEENIIRKTFMVCKEHNQENPLVKAFWSTRIPV